MSIDEIKRGEEELTLMIRRGRLLLAIGRKEKINRLQNTLILKRDVYKEERVWRRLLFGRDPNCGSSFLLTPDLARVSHLDERIIIFTIIHLNFK